MDQATPPMDTAVLGGYRTLLVVVDGNITARLYIDQILEPHMIRFMQQHPDITVFQQDNARPHSVRMTQAYLEAQGVDDLAWLEATLSSFIQTQQARDERWEREAERWRLMQHQFQQLQMLVSTEHLDQRPAGAATSRSPFYQLTTVQDGNEQEYTHPAPCLNLQGRTIRCLRNIIHWNLISAFILRNATWFIMQLTMNPDVHESNVLWCRMVTAVYNYFHVTNFFWMFGEGCYLHTAIVLTYSTDKLRKWMFMCIGWGIPFPIIIAWAFGKFYYDNEKCWFGKRAGVYTDYIYQGPMILVLMINFVFLFNIVRILMTKLKASTTSETIQYRKAVKATLVLLPLLGITYMLFFVNPGESEISQVVFIYFNSFLESFQGFFVSVFYCFLNSEVRSAARKRWVRLQDKHSIRLRVARAMSIPTSPTRLSFHSMKQSTSV
ncbi:hypothetical protein ACEWY4_003796 [Coilia grayii]|uniref:G-protein coupled receptors family 2 profile 2 domain-containing protein n=1 Tax=Coilia grayii TaxID=363190 RepID=A0ABD1KSA3_9TELE